MINRVVLVGRMTKDADLKYTSTGTPVSNFTLAITRSFNREETDFINCVVWRKPAENLANFTKKGSLIGIEGRIETRSYDGQDGKRVYVTEIVCDSVQFLDSKPKESNEGVTTQQTETTQKTSFNDDPFGGTNKTIDIQDEDLPF